jgi:hypothetical protein
MRVQWNGVWLFFPLWIISIINGIRSTLLLQSTWGVKYLRTECSFLLATKALKYFITSASTVSVTSASARIIVINSYEDDKHLSDWEKAFNESFIIELMQRTFCRNGFMCVERKLAQKDLHKMIFSNIKCVRMAKTWCNDPDRLPLNTTLLNKSIM